MTYHAEVALYGTQYQNILCSGTYDLVLQDSTAKLPRNDVKWMSVNGKRVGSLSGIFIHLPQHVKVSCIYGTYI